MAPSRIGISYTPSGGGSYNFLFDNFVDRILPRAYAGQYNYELSVTGAQVMSGAAFEDKYVWTIACYVTETEALQFDQMYQAWDADRATGQTAAVGVADETFGPTVNGSAIFLTPPRIDRLSPKTYLLSFGLQGV